MSTVRIVNITDPEDADLNGLEGARSANIRRVTRGFPTAGRGATSGLSASMPQGVSCAQISSTENTKRYEKSIHNFRTYLLSARHRLPDANANTKGREGRV
jgi:hypothetical protein